MGSNRIELITGSGMVASALHDRLAGQGTEVQMLGHSSLDVTNRDSVTSAITERGPGVIWHAAALTRVNYCEEHPNEAMAVNSEGTKNVVDAAAEVGAKLVYFSTDYVFDGSGDSQWPEDAEPSPINAYGASKLAGEQHVLGYENGYVIRTSGVFGPRSDTNQERNFFKVIGEILHKEETRQVRVVSDQFTAVTFAPHLAEIAAEIFSLDREIPRILHITSSGSNSWYGWAVELARLQGVDTGRVFSVTTAEFGDTTPRPANSVLGTNYPDLVGNRVREYSAIRGIDEYLHKSLLLYG